jgi:O-ureido-D-serine cyclo-ligase
MKSIDIVLVTSSELPELFEDDRPLANDLRARGHSIAIAAWDDPDFDWAAAKIAFLRSPWDYFHRLAEFSSWAARLESSVTRLLNPWPVVRWNLHKSYLLELAARGAPVVPTELLRRGEPIGLAQLAELRGWNDLVLKPAVSADSWETHRLRGDELPTAGQAHLDRLIDARDLIVQPYLAGVEDAGERCLVFIDGDYSHAVRKNALTLGGRWTDLPEGVPVDAAGDELEAARRVLAAAALSDLLYARVDLVRSADGSPRLLELELFEPTLFLAEQPAARVRLVAALERRLERAPARL